LHRVQTFDRARPVSSGNVPYDRFQELAMKQVIVVNEDLHLPRGKLAAQVAHASLAAFLGAEADNQRAWLQVGMPKIVLKCPSASDLKDLLAQAEAASVAAYLVHDAGRTQLAPGTITCLGIGPAPSETINKLTGDLKLL